MTINLTDREIGIVNHMLKLVEVSLREKSKEREKIWGRGEISSWEWNRAADIREILVKIKEQRKR